MSDRLDVVIVMSDRLDVTIAMSDRPDVTIAKCLIGLTSPLPSVLLA